MPCSQAGLTEAAKIFRNDPEGAASAMVDLQHPGEVFRDGWHGALQLGQVFAEMSWHIDRSKPSWTNFKFEE